MVRARMMLVSSVILLGACHSAPPATDARAAHTATSVESDDGESIPRLRFDGVYRSERVDAPSGAYWYYLRFYPDGDMVEVSSSGTPADLRRWFSRSNDSLPHGRYVVDGSSIAFSTNSAEGVVEYAGDVLNRALFLRSESHINGFRAERTYRFVVDARGGE